MVKNFKKKKLILLLFAVLALFLVCVIVCRYYLYTDDTSKFHSYLNQANGIRVTIYENGGTSVNSGIISSEESLYREICDLFSTVRLRPSLRQALEKFFTGKAYMVGDEDAEFSIFITLFQDGEAKHSIFLGGTNNMYFDKKEFYMGDFSNTAELQLMNQIYAIIDKHDR